MGSVQTPVGSAGQTVTKEKTEGNSSDRKHFETDTEKTDTNEEKQLGQVQIDITKFLLTGIDRKKRPYRQIER